MVYTAGNTGDKSGSVSVTFSDTNLDHLLNKTVTIIGFVGVIIFNKLSAALENC